MNIPSKKEAKKKEWKKIRRRGKMKKGSTKDKRNYCVGAEPSELVYIGILVTSTITGHGGSVVSALSSQAKGFISQLWHKFFFPQIFFFLPFPTSVRPNGQSINLVRFCQ